MKVYVLNEEVDYEGEYVRGVYMDEAAAIRVGKASVYGEKKPRGWDGFEVKEFEVVE